MHSNSCPRFLAHPAEANPSHLPAFGCGSSRARPAEPGAADPMPLPPPTVGLCVWYGSVTASEVASPGDLLRSEGRETVE
eukprot:2577150-Rhodomonas_salina.1